MKPSAVVETKRNSFSIDSIIAGNRTTSPVPPPPAPRFDTRSYGPASAAAHQLSLNSRSIPTDAGRLSDPSLQASSAAAAAATGTGIIYDEREVMRRHASVFDSYAGRYPNYDRAVAQFAAAAAAMATMTSCPGVATVDTSARAGCDSYPYWMHAGRQHAPPALFLPGKTFV